MEEEKKITALNLLGMWTSFQVCTIGRIFCCQLWVYFKWKSKKNNSELFMHISRGQMTNDWLAGWLDSMNRQWQKNNMLLFFPFTYIFLLSTRITYAHFIFLLYLLLLTLSHFFDFMAYFSKKQSSNSNCCVFHTNMRAHVHMHIWTIIRHLYIR